MIKKFPETTNRLYPKELIQKKKKIGPIKEVPPQTKVLRKQ